MKSNDFAWLPLIVKQFTLHMSPGVVATCQLDLSEQLPHMTDSGAEGIVVKLTANASGKICKILQGWSSQQSAWNHIAFMQRNHTAWIKVHILLVNQWQCLNLLDWLLSFPTTNDSWEAILMRFHTWCIAFLVEDGWVFGQGERRGWKCLSINGPFVKTSRPHCASPMEQSAPPPASRV